MKVLVTGAAGFIGRAVVAELARQLPASDITAVVRTAGKAAALEASGVRVVVADLRESSALHSQIDRDTVVFHLAARVTFGLHGRDIDFHSDNVIGTERLLEACPEGLRRFVHMSSINAVERRLADPCIGPLTEDSPCDPQTAYGQSKRGSEEVVRRLAPSKQIPFLMLRPPSIVYGAGCDPNSGMAQLIRRTAEGSLLPALDLPGRFSIIHVRDLAEATVRLGLSDALANETFFLADEPPRTVREVCDAVARLTGRPPRHLPIPRMAYQLLAAAVGTALKVPALAKRVPFQVLMLLRDQAAVSSVKARRLAGFTTRISLEEGLRDTLGL